MGAALRRHPLPIDEQMQGRDARSTRCAGRRRRLDPGRGRRRHQLRDRRGGGRGRRLDRRRRRRHHQGRRTPPTATSAIRSADGPSRRPHEYFVQARQGRRLREPCCEVSTPNISDALHRSGRCPGMLPASSRAQDGAAPRSPCAPYPGDWAKPVEAIDHAQPGDVLVIDAGGAPPAVWGELATKSAKVKGRGRRGHRWGAIRDTTDIARPRVPRASHW